MMDESVSALRTVINALVPSTIISSSRLNWPCLKAFYMRFSPISQSKINSDDSVSMTGSKISAVPSLRAQATAEKAVLEVKAHDLKNMHALKLKGATSKKKLK